MMNPNPDMTVTVIGAGLAGAEAAWQIASRGVDVVLVEMKPNRYTPAHHSPAMAELVCSNSLRSRQLSNAVGLLKEEMRRLGSLIMTAADACEVPAGAALAVDRDRFSAYVTEKITSHPHIRVESREVTELPRGGITVVATGPLTTESLSDAIAEAVGVKRLHFFDAAAPIVDAATVDMEKAYYASRYGKGDPTDYVNCPMSREEYAAFYEALITAEEAALHDFDRAAQKNAEPTVFEGCMPVEIMARRGFDTLLYGPLKPVGLPDPRTGRDPFGVVQLRKENLEQTAYNLVGFQTHLTFAEQKRVFRMIPGLENAEFLRYGVMHRNTFLDSPRILSADYSLRTDPSLFFAGQMTGVEGYLESAASGLVAGLNAARRALGEKPFFFDRLSVIGAMAAYVSSPATDKFQPMNANFGLVPMPDHKIKGGKTARNEALAERSLTYIDSIRDSVGLCDR